MAVLNGTVTASYCCFYDLQSYGYGAQKFLPGHSFSQADWHHISQHAEARDGWAPLLKLVHSGCHFLPCHSVLLWRRWFFPWQTENSVVKCKGTWDWLNLGGQHSCCLYSHRFRSFLWLQHTAGKLRKCLLPQVAAGGGILRVSLNTMLKYWLQSRSHEAFLFHSSSVFGLLCIYFIFIASPALWRLRDGRLATDLKREIHEHEL